MNLKEVVFEIENTFSMKQAEDFDNVGLLCGNPEREITGILVCHDALEKVVDEAVACSANLIVTFHPIIFSGLKSLTGKNYVERAVLKAVESKIAIYAIHTAFDNDYYGVNFGICERLGLSDQKILMPKRENLKTLEVMVPADDAEALREALFSAGAGGIGFYDQCSFSHGGTGTFRPLAGSDPYSGKQGERSKADEEKVAVVFEAYKQNRILRAMKEAHPYEEVAYNIIRLDNENPYSGLGRYGDLPEPLAPADFLKLVKEKFSLEVIRHSAQLPQAIRRVGVLGGSGASGIDAAIAAGCDAYLTGDVKYHDFFKAEDKMMICDIGHYESEQFVTQQLFEILSEKFPKFAVSKSTGNTNPVNYFL
ncbi:Nif3-like dinuclear metal center hexameric protein [Chryseobacterium sp.]|uniref:Nif3-like dinuclear metal center hexameric protein n=1 Tax=Chryseobacterium sp. TaxID=1871047 RepID=UPI0012AA77DD|nr:Nif3-like dinuclear metal center hexameric protein [Chryseobacterium sp.]QFG53574.1 Nif3-like dinuclear metal center hexameric protein [Chryseobacterium sp.]